MFLINFLLKIICGVTITSCSGQDPHVTDDSILSSAHTTPVHKSATLDPIRRRGNHGNISSSNPNLAGSNNRDAEDDQGSLWGRTFQLLLCFSCNVCKTKYFFKSVFPKVRSSLHGEIIVLPYLTCVKC